MNSFLGWFDFGTVSDQSSQESELLYPKLQRMTLRHILPLTLAAGTLLLASCNGSKTMTPKQAGEVEILEYCSSEDYRSDKNFFRATATGESMSREAAKKIAAPTPSDARTVHQVHHRNRHRQLREQLQVQQRGRGHRDVQRPRTHRGGPTALWRHHRVQPVDPKARRQLRELLGDRVERADLVSKYNERLSDDERIRAEYNYERFKETFEAEMAKQR